MLGQVKLNGQEKEISLKMGYPINLTDHWLIRDWENPINLGLKYYHDKKLLSIGGGMNYSKYDISWSGYHYSDKNTVSELSPFLFLGLNFQKEKVAFKPGVQIGYSFLLNNIESYQGKDGALYMAPAVDVNIDIFNRFLLGLNVSYNMTFTTLNFKRKDDIVIPANVIPYKDKTIKSLTFGLNFIYEF